MWLLFSIFTVLLWGTSDVIFKSAVSNDKNSTLKLIVYNGIMLGVCAIFYIIIKKINFDFRVIGQYLPIALIYIASMFLYYQAIKLVKVSIVSPIANCSCALTVLLCTVILKQVLTIPQIFAVIAIIISIIFLSINKDEAEDEGKYSKKSYILYIIGLSYALGYFVLDGVGSFMDEYALVSDLTADEVIIAFSFIYFLISLICFCILKYKEKSFNIFDDRRKLIGSFIETLGQYTYIYAFSFGDAGIASPFIASFSIVSIVLSRIFLKEKLNWKQYLLILLAFVGMIILAL